MENNNPIKEFDFTLIANFFRGLDRQGPGSDEQTLRAIAFIRDFLPQNRIVEIADLGCGTGRQTAVLAKDLNCHITAVDFLPQMIVGLENRIAKQQLQSKITPLQGSMDSLPFDEESMDIIWAEGSIYNMGFENGLREWHKFLVKGGFVAVTECCWLSDKRPNDTKWFTDNFVEIDTIPNKLTIMQHAGYEPIAAFVLPRECWTDNYYKPMSTRIEQFEQENLNNVSAETLLSNLRIEIDYYNRLGEYYGYVFFIGRK